MESVVKLYTVKDLKQWLLHNANVDGLSEQIIAPQRAYAIMNNPFVTDDDAVLCAIFEDGELAAYTAAFPEVLERPKRERIWWFTTLYCRPESNGKGYGLIVVGTLAEIYGFENCFDMDGASETVEIFKLLGHKCSYIQRFVFRDKIVRSHGLKGFIACCINKLRSCFRSYNILKIKKNLCRESYRVLYSKFINDETYGFITNQSSYNVFVRGQQMMNWILRYPFAITSPLIDRVELKIYISFSSNSFMYDMDSVNVYLDSKLIGFYIYRIMDGELSIVYLYYLSDYSKKVFSSIVEHFIVLKANSLKTTSKDFAYWFNRCKLTDKFVVENQSFSYPKQFAFKENGFIQMGDGDAFV